MMEAAPYMMLGGAAVSVGLGWVSARLANRRHLAEEGRIILALACFMALCQIATSVRLLFWA